ncbi:MAG: DUF2911 domain-containing protein [Acidobacteriota bacterium]
MKVAASVGVLTIVFGLFAAYGRAVAQAPKPSQHGSVSQQVGDTTIVIDYNRPVARGRNLFGALVPFGRVWCPGADSCTTIELSTDVKVNGQALAAGTYSLWAEPQADRWTMIFNRAHPVFHTRYPADQDVLRVTATPRQGTHVETLAFYFPVVDGGHAELVLHWGTVVVPLSIDVSP